MPESARRVSLRPKLVQFSSIAGCALVTLALIALLGWILEVSMRHRFGFQIAEMKANAAVAFFFVGLALLGRDRPNARIYSVVVMAIGAATLAEYLIGTDLGIDQLLFRDSSDSSLPGRMTQFTSIGFVAVGTALALMRSSRKRLRDVSRALAFVTGCIGITALLGYPFGIGLFYQKLPDASVALSTAFGLVIAAAGVTYSNFSEGLVQRIHADTRSGKMLRRLLPAAIFIPYLIIVAVDAAGKYFGWGEKFALALISGGVVFALVLTLFSFARVVDREELAEREGERRFRFIADMCPALVWRSTTKRVCDYFNQTWLDFTGRTMQQEIGNGWAEGVHAEDLRDCMETYRTSFNKRERFTMQYRLRRFDGEYRWLLDIGVPRFTPEGSFAGYIGSCIDITEQKLAQEALEDFGRKLIQAQEEERTWIAREIHDDFQQRLAMLAIHLAAVEDDQKSSREEVAHRVKELRAEVINVGRDLHSLSHRLHSSTLRVAGLVPGLRSLCNEYTDNAGISVLFQAEEMPASIPDEVSICLFRVAQEALRNVKKHSGAAAAEVRLSGVDGKVHLSISDRGKGFDPGAEGAQAGIGIRGMRERIRLVGGQLELNTRPLEGSCIDAWVPVQTNGNLFGLIRPSKPSHRP